MVNLINFGFNMTVNITNMKNGSGTPVQCEPVTLVTC